MGHAIGLALAFVASLFPLPIGEVLTVVVSRNTTQESVSVLFAGDMMFDRSIRIKGESRGWDYLFSCIDATLARADIVVANLEGPITPNPSVNLYSVPGDPSNFTFTFPLSIADTLYKHNIRFVNLGNNHISNFGTDGVVSTVDALRRSGVAYFGDPIESSVGIYESKGVRIAFITYNEFGGKASTTFAQIKKQKEEGFFPVVYTHWGDEYEPQSAIRSQLLAHRFIDAGAEMVIGSHPHVVQESEMYKGKHIYYSLGNFIFDQYWNEQVRTGLLLRVRFSRNGVESVEKISVFLGRDRRTCPVFTSILTSAPPSGSSI